MIQEAYRILGNEKERKKYDRERWLSGEVPTNTNTFTAFGLIDELEQLHVQLSRLNESHIDLGVLYQIMSNHLAENKLHNLLIHATANQIVEIVGLSLSAIGRLPLHQQPELLQQLILLTEEQKEQQVVINRKKAAVEKKLFWRKMMPWIGLLLTIILCLATYWYGKLTTSGG